MSGKILERMIEDIEARNSSVELNKAWETGLTRRFSIAVLTYIIAVFFLQSTGVSDKVLLSALVPTGGYIVSTLSLKLLREFWERKLK